MSNLNKKIIGHAVIFSLNVPKFYKKCFVNCFYLIDKMPSLVMEFKTPLQYTKRDIIYHESQIDFYSE
ncbi:hypothetical protein KFK09_013664 [Dendrobium nobile]|uniref:Uncharacterized protein n=1 Tax=Dendrobium nobile TaxID=94219 RepID=A0A8T3B9Q1_DENNO|nr:hypothetical protein KFK09_013664 [Dendrobium nobile]